jgi:hypothetical protein
MIKSINTEPLHYNGNVIDIGVGIGIAIYPDHSNKKKEIIKFADIALATILFECFPCSIAKCNFFSKSLRFGSLVK